MKKLFAALIMLLSGSGMYANPIPIPTLEISELWFDESDNWALELCYYYVAGSGLTFDSIYICSTSGSVKLPSYGLEGDIGVLVITLDSLESDFNINRSGDTLKVISYILEGSFEDCLIFGDLQGASVDIPEDGQSVCRYGNYFVKDKSPTIGEMNDTCGICGTLAGTVYDKNSVPVENRTFQLDFSFETSGGGEYRARVCSRPSTFNRVCYRTGHEMRSVSISEISFIMEPDSVVQMDIYLLDTLYSGTELHAYDDPVQIFPNPVQMNERLYFRIELPVISSDIRFEMVDMDGRMVKKEQIRQQESWIDPPSDNGLYLLCVWVDDQLISSRKILVR